MRYIADLHVHSHYSRATSKDLNLESLYQWAKIKGINVVGTGDFTHPAWFAELKEKLQPDGNGFYLLKDPPEDPAIPGITTQDIDVRFCLTTEISSIYKFDERVRKNHNLIFAPDLDTVARINHRLESIGNLEADGRPILGLPSRDLLEIVLETSNRAYLVPAHIWTPWFSTLGSKAGYDSIRACFRDLTDHLFALETGLSSDPAMNWKLSNLDPFTLISNSDAHSPAKLGREANLLDTELSYDGLFNAIKTGNGFLGSYEFYPEEGKYHHDGHRKCNLSLKPDETKKYNGICPSCGKPLTVGVLHRVEDLSDREESKKPERAAGYNYIIPLPEVLGEIEDVGPNTKTVREKYRQVISAFGNEFTLLRDVPIEVIQKQNGPVLAEAVQRIRDNEVNPVAGYDGVYGVIKVFEEGEIDRIRGQLGFFGIDEYRMEKQVKAADPETIYKAESENDEDKTYSLNDKQLEVARSMEGKTLVKAGPGTGKTHTLIEWIVTQVESGPGKASHILAVTFTNKSADELKYRLAERVGNKADSMTIGTFHAIAWQLLRDRHPDLDTVYDKASRRMALRFLLPELKASERQELEEKLVEHFELDTPLSDKHKGYVRRYRNYLQEQGAIDLSDLIHRAVKGLEEDPDWLEQVRVRYRTIAVDEFQDINPLQYQLIRLLAGGDKHRVLAIGDPDQAIYGFRGSDISLFYRFAREFKATEIVLNRNYRSTGNILAGAGAVIKNNEMHGDVRLIPNKNRGSGIRIYRADHPFDESDYILDQIERYVGGVDNLASAVHTDSRHSYGFGDIAVLFRTNAVGEALFKSFLRAGIPAHFGDGTAFLSEPPFTIISNLIRLWIKPESRIPLSDLLSEAYGWTEAQINSLLASLNEHPESLFGDDPLENVSEGLGEDLNDLHSVYGELSPSYEKSGMKKVVELISNHFMPEDLLTESQLLKKETLLDLAEEAEGDAEHFLEQMQLNPYTDAGRLKTEGVHLLTFHAAKGLEFPVVFIAAADEEITPLLREGTDMEEERRLFYVAMTRAEAELQITSSKERSRYGELRTMEASRFIFEIPKELKEPVGMDEKRSKTDSPPEGEQMGLF